MNTLKKKTLKGFSLMESMIAMFIFSMFMVVVTGFFSKFIFVGKNAQQLQQNLEDTQFAMNRVAKVLRTSVIINPSSNNANHPRVRVFDYSQNKCIEYEFSGNSFLEKISGNASSTGDPKAWCAGLSSASLSSGSLIQYPRGVAIDGKFSIVPSTATQAGRVLMNVEMTRGNHSVTAQTSMSLRNFTAIYP